MTPEVRRDFYIANRRYPGVIAIHEIGDVLGEVLPDLNFDRERFTNSTYLAFARYLVAELLWIAQAQNLDPAQILAANLRNGAKGKGLLRDDEVNLILKGKVRFPLPWTPDRCKYDDPPASFEGQVATLDTEIAEYADNGFAVGLISGVWDILHAGHVGFILETIRRLEQIKREKGYKNIVLFVGVDDNDLVSLCKGNLRPVNDFSVRAGSLSGIANVLRIFRITDTFTYLKKQSPEKMFVGLAVGEMPSISLNARDRKNLLTVTRAALEDYNPGWFQKTGPNLYYFITQGDPLSELKRGWIETIGGNCVAIPKLVSVTSSDIVWQFGVRQSDFLPNAFGQPAWWQTQK